MRLVLFDIDGTLLTGGGAGSRAIRTALQEHFGATGPADYRFDGKTDPQIVRDLMRAEGHGDDVIDARMAALFARYVECLHDELCDPTSPPRACAGVPALLDALEGRDDVVLGLLTGNVEAGAAAKLSAVGIARDRFVVGAFGSDHEHRPNLHAVAQRRAREILGLDLPGDALVVIGDTPADIACGQAVGARTIGVATGRYSVHELRAHRADAVFPDFCDTTAVVTEMLGT